MLRRSPRLISNGYYDPNDHTIRLVSYKETPIRIFKKRKKQKHQLGGACRNLIDKFNLCDLSLESQGPKLTAVNASQYASPPSSCSSVVRKVVLLILYLTVLGFGVWLCYKQMIQIVTQQKLECEQEIKLMKLTISEQGLKKGELEEIIDKVFTRHRADDIGMADYALESLGATVTDSTETLKTTYCKLLGIRMWCRNNGPETVIQPDVHPGKCWPFSGSQGYLVISLAYPVRITHVTLEHLPRVLSPTDDVRTAPRDFAVYGMVNKQDEGKLLGKITYDQDGEPIQTFELKDSPSEVYGLVKLRILSNWGNPKYTCVYRFRVHSQQSTAKNVKQKRNSTSNKA